MILLKINNLQAVVDELVAKSYNADKELSDIKTTLETMSMNSAIINRKLASLPERI